MPTNPLHLGLILDYFYAHTQIRDYDLEAENIRRLVEETQPGARRLLDVGCATGEHALRLKAFYQVDGIDLDPELVELACQKNPEGRFEVADMRTFELGRQYDVVLCLSSTIGYARTLEELASTLKCLRRCLAPGGVVLVEPWFPPDVWKPGKVNSFTAETANQKVVRMTLGGLTQTAEGAPLSTLEFFWLVGTEQGIFERRELHELGLFTVEQMKNAFLRAGLSVEFEPEGAVGWGVYVARNRDEGR